MAQIRFLQIRHCRSASNVRHSHGLAKNGLHHFPGHFLFFCPISEEEWKCDSDGIEVRLALGDAQPQKLFETQFGIKTAFVQNQQLTKGS